MAWSKNKQDLAESQDKVYPAALRYLQRRDYAESELRQRLLRRGADAEAVDNTVARLYEAGYLDQQRFAGARVRSRRDINPRGRYAVRMELRELGLSEAEIEEALSAEYSEEQERATLRSLVERELQRAPAEAEPRRRFIASLQRRLIGRGFRAGDVYELIREQADAL